MHLERLTDHIGQGHPNTPLISEEPDRILIGCHEPGHYAGGMKLAITVA